MVCQIISKFVKKREMKPKVIFNTDQQAATVYIMKVLDAPSPDVWMHFTNPDLLDLWWAPKPWKAETIKMNFEPNGIWNYMMSDPENQKQYAGFKYHEINNHRSFDFTDFMSDDQGNIMEDIPTSNWLVGFTGVEEGTKLTINIHFNNEAEMIKLMNMGFEERVTTSLAQLETLLHKKD